MQKISLRKLSVLGVVLLAASAVTAAIMPSKKPVFVQPGRCFAEGAGAGAHITCTVAVSGNGSCDVSAYGQGTQTAVDEGLNNANDDTNNVTNGTSASDGVGAEGTGCTGA